MKTQALGSKSLKSEGFPGSDGRTGEQAWDPLQVGCRVIAGLTGVGGQPGQWGTEGI